MVADQNDDDEDVIKFPPILEHGYPHDDLRDVAEFRQKILASLMIKPWQIFPDRFSPPNPIIHSMTTEEATEWLFKLASQGVSFSIDYDVDYGVDNHTGWSVVIDKSVMVSLIPEFEAAIAKAKLMWDDICAHRADDE